MSELEQRVARGIAQAGGFDYERGETAIVMDNYARAALKAHAEWLEEQGLEIVCTGRPGGRRPTIEELEKILEGPAGRVRITPAGEVVVEAAAQEEQP